MKKIGQLILIIFSLFFFSCTSAEKIQQNLNSDAYSLAYLMDSKIVEEKKDIDVKFEPVQFNASGFHEETVVNKIGGMFIPLVFVYVWNSKNSVLQGKSMILENIPDFLYESVHKEAERSGIFSLDSSGNPDYVVELSIDEIRTEGPYVSKGFFVFTIIFQVMTYNDYAGPALSNLQISYKLKKEGRIVHQNTFTSSKTTEPILHRFKTLKELQANYAISMVEANSHNFENIVNQIVADINANIEEEAEIN